MRGVMDSIPVDVRVDRMRGVASRLAVCLSARASAPAVAAQQERHGLWSSGSDFLRLFSLISRAFPRPLMCASCS